MCLLQELNKQRSFNDRRICLWEYVFVYADLEIYLANDLGLNSRKKHDIVTYFSECFS